MERHRVQVKTHLGVNRKERRADATRSYLEASSIHNSRQLRKLNQNGRGHSGVQIKKGQCDYYYHNYVVCENKAVQT